MKLDTRVPWQKSENECEDGPNQSTATPTKRY